jgi:hypothetical protein
MSEAKTICYKDDNILPEIKTMTELKMVKEIMKDYNLTHIPAGFKYDPLHKDLRFVSNNGIPSTIIEKVRFLQNNIYVVKNLFDQDIPISKNNTYYMYHFKPTYGIIMLVQKDIETYRGKIICQIRRPAETDRQQNNFLLKITSSMCNKDLPDLKGKTDIITKEAAFFDPVIRTQEDQPTEQENTNTQEIKPYKKTRCRKPECNKCSVMAVLLDNIRHLIAFTSQKTNGDDYKAQMYVILRILQLPNVMYQQMFDQHDRKFYKEAHDKHIADTIHYIHCQYLTTHTDPTTKVGRDDYKDYEIIEWEAMLMNIYHLLESLRPTIERKKRQIIPIFYMPNMQHVQQFVEEKQRKQTNILLNNTKSIQALAINQEEIKITYDKLAREIYIINNISRINEFAIATLMSEIDAKAACTNLHNAVQFSLLKLADAMAMSIHNKVSPYVLGERELDTIVAQNSRKQIHLSNDINHVGVTLHKTDEEYIFILSVPIIDSNHLYTLYITRPIPIFTLRRGVNIMAKPDAEYIGISADTTKTITFPIIEFMTCIQQPFCRTTRPIEAITNKTCTAHSHRNDEPTCEFKPISPKAQPFFATYGNETLYSVPENYVVEVICPNTISTKAKTPLVGKQKLPQLGSFTLDPGCYVDTLDGRQILPHTRPDYSQDLGVTTIEEALKYIPRITSFALPTEDDIHNRPIAELEYMPVNPVSFGEAIKQVYAPNTMIPHLLRDLLIAFTIIILIIAIMCCFPQVRAWVKACCFINNPTKYWRRYKHYDVPSFNKIPQFTMPDSTPIIKTIFTKGGIQKYKVEREQRKQRKQVFKNKFEIDEILNKNKAACEAQAKLITAPITQAPIIQNNKPIYPPTAPSSFKPDIPRLPEISTKTAQVHWQDN